MLFFFVIFFVNNLANVYGSLLLIAVEIKNGFSILARGAADLLTLEDLTFPWGYGVTLELLHETRFLFFVLVEDDSSDREAAEEETRANGYHEEDDSFVKIETFRSLILYQFLWLNGDGGC